jgi:ribosomal protein S18 acetylase RimI-like enzyme
MATFRMAQSKDLEGLLLLIKEFCEIDNHVYDEYRIKSSVTPLFSNNTLGVIILAEIENQLVGYAVLTWGWSVESGGREGLIDEIYVKNRNSGLGSKLLEEVIRVAKEFDVKMIFLETESANERVRGFYRRHGFTQEDSIWLSHKLIY